LQRSRSPDDQPVAENNQPATETASAQRATANSSPVGFMEGSIAVPDDFDRIGIDEIERLFGIE
jgi:hypothetical protein